MLRFRQCRWLLALEMGLSVGTASPFAVGDDGVAQGDRGPGSEAKSVASVPWLDLRPEKGSGLTADEEKGVREQVARLESQVRKIPGFKTWSAPQLWNADGAFVGKHRVVGNVEWSVDRPRELKSRLADVLTDAFKDSLIVSEDDVHGGTVEGAIIVTSGSFNAASVTDCLIFAGGGIRVGEGTRSLLCAECPVDAADCQDLILASSSAVRVRFGGRNGGRGNVIVNSPPLPEEHDTGRNYGLTNRNPAADLHNDPKISLTPKRTVLYLPKIYRIERTEDGKSVTLHHYRDRSRMQHLSVGDEITDPDGNPIPAVTGWRVQWHPMPGSIGGHLLVTKDQQSAIVVY